jgi:large subunit ribosomal protein L4
MATRNSSFSSVPPRKKKVDLKSTIVELPPNLKIDPRAKSSPFYGAMRVVVPEKKQKRDKNGKVATTADNVPEFASISVDVVDPAKESATDGRTRREVASAGGEAAEDEDDDDEVDGDDDEDDDEDEERILYDLSTRPDVPRAVPLPQRLRVPVLDLKTGEEVGTIHLSDRTFGNDPVRVDILHRVVVWQRNKKRGRRNAGARTKTIHEVSGSGRKVRPQKGGGQARAGHSRPAHWRGGAKAHGPKGRVQDYTTKLNKKVRKMGVRHALSQKLKEGNLIVTSDMAVPTHKTGELDAMLGRLGISGGKKRGSANALFVDDASPSDYEDGSRVYGRLDVNFKVASGNLQKVKILNQMGCNVYDMLKFRKLVLSLAAVRSLEERLEKDL